VGQVTGAVQANQSDNQLREAFTKNTAAETRRARPDKNVMVVFNAHDQNFTECEHTIVTCALTPPRTMNYHLYVFKDGTFTHNGDGGFINWAFEGFFKREGNKVTFTAPPAAANDGGEL